MRRVPPCSRQADATRGFRRFVAAGARIVGSGGQSGNLARGRTSVWVMRDARTPDGGGRNNATCFVLPGVIFAVLAFIAAFVMPLLAKNEATAQGVTAGAVAQPASPPARPERAGKG